MPDDKKVLHEFKRNADETTRVSLAKFKGRTYIDFRIFYTDNNEELQPTKKGITVTPELWDEFRVAVDKAEQALVEANLWHAPTEED